MVPEVTARLRPRSGWESQDLGLAMARGLIGRLLWHWCVLLIPFWLLLALALQNYPWAFFWITWWLKPVYDRIPLFTMSRRLFGQETKLRTVLKALPGLLFKGNWYFLTFGRLSFYRCFSMPVKVLEGGSHSTYRRRVGVLLRQGDSTVMWVTLGWLLCSVFTVFGCWELLSSLMVDLEETEDPFAWYRMMGNSWQQMDHTLVWTMALLHLLAMTLTEIFYMGAGFGLYLNSRSHLEGWDIEVTFRSLAARLQELAGSTVGLVLGVLLVLGSPAQAITPSVPKRVAQPPVASGEGRMNRPEQSAQRVAKEVKADPDFKIHTEEYTVFDDVSKPAASPPGSGGAWGDIFGGVLTIVGYALLAALVCFLVALCYKFRHVFAGGGGSAEPVVAPKARVVLGMDVTPEALPLNIPDAAAQAWRAGDVRLALRLLYAGSLHWMIDRARLPIQESDTEGDCLRHSRQLTEPQQTTYFHSLTQLWMGHAYGSRIPADAAMEQCIHQWPFQK